MTIYWNANSKGFYDTSVHDVVPDNSVEISESKWNELLTGQASGLIITSDSVGNPILVPYTPTLDETLSAINTAIQSALDSGAQKWGYANMVTACSYVGSNNAQYAADALALSDWRDSVWAWAYPLYPSVTPGESPATFMATMPPQPPKPVVS